MVGPCPTLRTIVPVPSLSCGLHIRHVRRGLTRAWLLLHCKVDQGCKVRASEAPENCVGTPASCMLHRGMVCKKDFTGCFSSIATVLAGSGDDYSADVKPTCSLQLTETGNDATKEAEAQAFRSRCAAGSAWYFSFFFFFLIELSMAYSTQPHIRGVSTGRRAQEHVTVGPTPLAHMDLGARKRSGQGGKCQHS